MRPATVNIYFSQWCRAPSPQDTVAFYRPFRISSTGQPTGILVQPAMVRVNLFRKFWTETDSLKPSRAEIVMNASQKAIFGRLVVCLSLAGAERNASLAWAQTAPPREGGAHAEHRDSGVGAAGDRASALRSEWNAGRGRTRVRGRGGSRARAARVARHPHFHGLRFPH